MSSVRLALSNGHVTLIDALDLPRVQQYHWSAYRHRDTWYVRRDGVAPPLYLHRFLLDAPSGMEVDHINGNGLDNTRDNLRLCTHAQNLQNQRLSAASTSGYRGVSLRKGRITNPWHAHIKHHGRLIHIGDFPTIEAAVAARAAKEAELWGPLQRDR